MCFAIPGKVVSIEGDKVIVDYGVEKREVGCVFDVSIGDWVIVSNKIIIKKVPEEEALEAIKMISQEGVGSEESVEQYFFKYAFPCSQTLMELGRITKEEYEELKKMFLEGKVPDREVLERVFCVAFERISRLAIDMGKNKWDLDVNKEYWLKRHNEVIDNGEGMYGKAPESFKDLCRINIAEVVERKGDKLIVRYGSENSRESRVVFDTLIPEVRVGDRIKIHYGYGVEVVDKVDREAERVAIFIDGSNFYHNLKRYWIKKKFQEIIKILEKERNIVDIFYYTAELDIHFDEERYLQHQRFLEKIKKIPNFNIVLCTLRKIVNKDGNVSFVIKGDDVYLANDMLKGAYENLYDIAILVSGDEDFIPVIKTIQKLNKKVINVYFPKTSSYLLRKSCDYSINLKRELRK